MALSRMWLTLYSKFCAASITLYTRGLRTATSPHTPPMVGLRCMARQSAAMAPSDGCVPTSTSSTQSGTTWLQKPVKNQRCELSLPPLRSLSASVICSGWKYSRRVACFGSCTDFSNMCTTTGCRRWRVRTRAGSNSLRPRSRKSSMEDDALCRPSTTTTTATSRQVTPSCASAGRLPAMPDSVRRSSSASSLYTVTQMNSLMYRSCRTTRSSSTRSTGRRVVSGV
mmetsp:Transcript_17861/g.63042  ORF Transcript_17861/g.63042 Transcript_17861/m.63042 type:complete len:226 (-) Transcript_17861:1044-1721(-)